MKRDWDLLRKQLADVEEERNLFFRQVFGVLGHALKHVEIFLDERCLGGMRCSTNTTSGASPG